MKKFYLVCVLVLGLVLVGVATLKRSLDDDFQKTLPKNPDSPQSSLSPLALEITKQLDRLSGGSDALLSHAQIKAAIEEIERFEKDSNPEVGDLVGDLNLKKAQYLAMSNRKEEALEILKEFEESDESAPGLQCEIAHVKMLGGDTPQSIVESAQGCVDLQQGKQAETLQTGIQYLKQACGKDCASEVATLSSMLGSTRTQTGKSEVTTQ